MGSCTRRHFLLSTCFLQMITIIERQVFDFLGYMWAPIFVNFFHILFIIFGFYGAYHFRIKYIITYLIWSFLWIGWNAFLICFYLNVGTLDKDSDLLNLGTGSVSWFEVNGYGCKPTYPTNFTSEDPYRPIRPERVDDCLLTYDLIEVIHSGVQCALALLGILGAILISYIFLDEDDRFDFMNGDAKSPQHTVVHPMYVSYTSIPTSASATMLSTSNNKHINHHHLNNSNSNSNSYHLSTHHGVMQEQANYSPQQQQHKLHHKLHQYDQQQQNFSNSTTTTTNSNNKAINNGNTFLIHHHHNNHRATPNKGTSSLNSGGRTYLSGGSLNSQFNANNGSYSNRKQQKCNYSSRSNTPNASKTSTLTHMLYSPKQMRKIGSTTTSIFPAPTTTAVDLAYKQSFYDDSTAKADHQLYSNNSRHHFSPHTHTPTQDTTPSLSYASLQNSNQNLVSSLSGCGVAGGSRGGSACGGGVSSGTGTGILLERGAILQPASLQNPAMQVNILNPAQRILYQQNGLPFHPAYSPMTYRASNIPRPTNIPLPTIPAQVEGNELISPSDFTPPPPPHNPKPHIFQPRSGQAPYPDLSPEVAERYAMPTQYVPRSPVASRIIRRQRQQAQATQDKPFAVNFCDQIRDTPPGYTDNGYKIARAKSHDRLNNSQPVVLRDKEKSTSRPGESTPNGLQQIKDLAPHVNRRSGRRDGNKVRPRSYCNSMTGGEGVIRVNIATDRENSMRNEALSYAA
ncbi:sodium/potassium-transporting ATPase subunit beta-1-interacting protein isoform X2 [Glossina fuscipes]|uniref:Sodium/potassium-transporting ATPase subunit beta-1-interacting protein n=1 Tax=Glossina fuscipes TaxID=7396 RepID=A0A9C5Z201_9MUSC|nr:sodium/potassium-transporting ATPase subunit beta-1-interacting protein isoform X2 [Glossina fuscipes]